MADKYTPNHYSHKTQIFNFQHAYMHRTEKVSKAATPMNNHLKVQAPLNYNKNYSMLKKEEPMKQYAHVRAR